MIVAGDPLICSYLMCTQLNDGLQDSLGSFPVFDAMTEYTKFTIGKGPMVCVLCIL